MDTSVLKLNFIVSIQDRSIELSRIIKSYFNDQPLDLFCFQDIEAKQDVFIAEFGTRSDAKKAQILLGLKHKQFTRTSSLVIPTHYLHFAMQFQRDSELIQDAA